MNDETTFNKETFAMLLDRAKGDKSINQYANDTGVSAAHISRFLRQMINAAPTPETISKLTDGAGGGVSYRDMMVAAGHISNESHNIEKNSPKNIAKEAMKMEQDILQIVMIYLMNSDLKWNMEKPNKEIDFPDLIVNVEDSEYNRWYFEFKATKNLENKIAPSFYNQILRFELTEVDKFILVTNDEITFNYMYYQRPINLRANLFIMLVDLENKKIIREEQLTRY